MPVIFADPFGSFTDGFTEGRDLAIREDEQIRRERADELRFYDQFVFSPQQELAREQRAFDRQLQLIDIRRRDAASRQAAQQYDRGTFAGGIRRPGETAPRQGTNAAPGASLRNFPTNTQLRF